MNRRSFVSLLLGAAGAPLVPWRGLVEPVIVLPGYHALRQRFESTYHAVQCAYDDVDVVASFKCNHVSIDPHTGQFSIGGYFVRQGIDSRMALAGTKERQAG